MTPLFRRQQLEALARIIRKAYDTANDEQVIGVAHTVKTLAEGLQVDNPRFDHARFIAAIRRGGGRMMTAQTLRHTLADTFGREWYRLTYSDQQLIIADCTDTYGGFPSIADVNAFGEYRDEIGAGNLEQYAKRVQYAYERRLAELKRRSE